jgi:hypothetical protein
VLAGLTIAPPPEPRPHRLDPVQHDAPSCVLRLWHAPGRMAVTNLTAHGHPALAGGHSRGPC